MTTYQKRKRGLKKKVEEFATLCGVPTCMIIYGPKFKNRPSEVEVWPKGANDFMEVVNLYRDKCFSSRGTKAYNLFDFFNERKRKVDDKVKKLRKSNLESKFSSCWDDRLNRFSADQLRLLLATFDDNIELARRKILMIKSDQNLMDCTKSGIVVGGGGGGGGNNSNSSQSCLSPPCNLSTHHQVMIQKDIELIDHHNMQLYHHHHQPLQMLPYDLSPDLNQLTNVAAGDHHHQFGGVSALLPPALYFDPTPTVMINNTQRAMYIYGPSMQTLQTYNEQCPPLPSNIISSQMHGSYHHHHQHQQQQQQQFNMNHDFGFRNQQRGKL
ncbi:hypothetical protein JRO89_XS15G0184100 [Xanthoceras sorbifolium]|uniref:MADS-box domain-containing protein n=1 Tax=Xanthoceras sorbifolium TaxID=99658 RepID=A0ABQ8H2W4_9ROSI|nr:hypothetical protein JRO89_XS15G0184100 [Xanthoceras sorbifolium]